jgi:predicted ATP-grasp superfamily ATP-dependent carboligase
VIVQEFIPGKIHDVCTLSVLGQPVRLLTQVRELMYPIYGGVGAVNITTDDQSLRDNAEKLIIESGYHGPAQVEFKKDSRTGEYKLIEFNPKLWGTLPLSICAGVSFPELIRDYVLGKKLHYQNDYKVGLRYNFWLPLAFLAKLQLYKEFGLSQKRWETPYSCVKNDFDIRDIKPDFHRALSTILTLFKRKMVNVNANLPKELIPVPWKIKN